jgi:CHAD domain-containing protein
MGVDPKDATAAYLEHLAAQIRRAATNPDVDAVHDLRVAVRRATQALRIFQNDLPSGAKKVRRRIREIRERAGAVRDRDVIFALLRKMKLPATDPACAYLQGERAMAARELQETLQELIDENRPDRWIEAVL